MLISFFNTLAVVVLISFSTLVHADNYLQLGALQKSFHYKEFSESGTVIDREDGHVPGVSAELARDWGKYSSIFNVGYVDGEVRYDGQTQGGSPLITRTKERILDLSTIVLWSGGYAAEYPRLLAGLGYRRWVRDIQATATTNELYEKYQWLYWLIGANFSVWKHKQWEIGLDGRLLRPIKPRIYVEYPGYDSVSLTLGAEDGIRISVPISYRLNTKKLILVEGYYQTWKLSSSSSKRLYSGGLPTIYSASEPDSITEVYGVQLAVRFQN